MTRPALMFKKREIIYEGKAKKIFASDDSEIVIMEYKDSLTAFNAQKIGSFDGKGKINCQIATLIFQYLKQKGIESHWIKNISDTEMLVKKVKIVPLEVVVRNVLAGSTAKKFGIDEGKALSKPLVEFYFKDDQLGDPFVSAEQIEMLGLASESQLAKMKTLALKINRYMLELFSKVGIRLVDFKVEFGIDAAGNMILADEISPDCARLWDLNTDEKLDKDRFRRDLGKVAESYQDVLSQLKGVVNV